MRVDPDALLNSLKNQENRGKLTVFLGAMAGVGKTYSMLRVAKDRLSDGVNIVIGLVETHGRSETKNMAEGLPMVPPLQTEYRGKTFWEMDLDTLLNLHPQVVLVDELAHSNIPGSRHAKRYQDVEELLESGIDVYTTINIQHMESLNDIVARITGVTVQETVPDRILEKAFQIQLVDIPSEELVQRLQEGKIYLAGQAQKALNKFFRLGNINALRELALRYTAQRVDQQLANYMQAHAIVGPWPVQERIMVCISANPEAGQLIRAARRLAARLQGEWLAVYVETPRRLPVSQEEKEALAKNLRLAEDLGADTITVMGSDVAEEVLEIAKNRNVSQIVIGKPVHTKLWEWIHGSVADKLINKSEGITIHVIPSKAKTTALLGPVKNIIPKNYSFFPWLSIALMEGLVTAISSLLHSFLGPVNIVLIYLVPILISALRWGVAPAIAASFLGIIIFDFFFISPVLSFTVGDLRYVVSFIIFLLVAVLMGNISSRLHMQIGNARRREKSTHALYSLSKDMAAIDDLTTLVGTVRQRIRESIEGEIVIFLPDEKNKLIIACPQNDFMEQNEQAVAAWVFDNGQIAGRGTSTLAGALSLYFPLKTEQKTIGVLGTKALSGEFLPEEKHLLEAFANLAAMAINRIKLAKQAKETELLAESERLHTALFDSLSHDLRTPLASIIGAVSGLIEGEDIYNTNERRELLSNIQHGANRMNILVNNLLDMARLESGRLQLNLEWCDIQDILGVAIQRLGDYLKKRNLQIEVAEDLPLIKADYVLIEQVLLNLLENALKYSPEKSVLQISVKRKDKQILVKVTNQGSNIPENQLEQIFDKFYRLPDSQKISGSGLGLTICKGIIEAHKGKIWADNQGEDTITFSFTLPLSKKNFKKIGEEI